MLDSSRLDFNLKDHTFNLRDHNFNLEDHNPLTPVSLPSLGLRIGNDFLTG